MQFMLDEGSDGFAQLALFAIVYRADLKCSRRGGLLVAI
jgi:hypothetical protein